MVYIFSQTIKENKFHRIFVLLKIQTKMIKQYQKCTKINIKRFKFLKAVLVLCKTESYVTVNNIIKQKTPY